MKNTIVKIGLLLLPFNFLIPLSSVIEVNETLDIVTALVVSFCISLISLVIYAFFLTKTKIRTGEKYSWIFWFIFVPNLTQIIFWFKYILTDKIEIKKIGAESAD